MAFNFYDTTLLLDAVERIPKVSTFLRDRYFPTGDGDIFSTHSVLVEYRDGTKVVAPFVAERKGGVTMLRDGYEVKQYEPPRIAPRRALTLDDLKKRGFGEAILPTLTDAQRQFAITTKDMQELDEMITRREELMCAEVMQENKLTMKHIADDVTIGDEMVMQFYNGSSNPATYTPASNWSADSVTILKDIAAMIRMLTERGLGATDLIVGTDVADVLINNKTIQTLLDNRRYELGEVRPVTLPQGVARIMTLNINGRMVDIFCYEEEYTDYATKETKPFIDPKNVILTAPGAGRIAYGAVTQLEYSDGEFHTYTGKRIPKFIPNAEGNTRTITLTSRPLVMPKAQNPFIVSKVLA
ncbi:MAG: major capsid protein [Peptococcaceae bacterium]|nr:major capsid protein [Peptococcaceae bacterium]